VSPNSSLKKISVIVPKNPFLPTDVPNMPTCLAALEVLKLIEWWPGTPHVPHRNPEKVRNIQRSLDWKRVAQIASYLLQTEIIDAPKKLEKYFNKIYEPKKNDPGRQWPPRIPKIIAYQKSIYPTFSSVLLHINGAHIEGREDAPGGESATLVFDERSKDLEVAPNSVEGQVAVR